VSKSLGMRVSLLGMLMAFVALAFSASASALIAVGQVAPPNRVPNTCSVKTPYDELQQTTAAGDSYRVPTAGTLVSWSTRPGVASGQVMGFKVFRPTAPGTYTVVGQDGPRLLTPGVLNSFFIAIPVQEGDLIGIHLPGGAVTDCNFTALAGDSVRFGVGDTPVGASTAMNDGMFSDARLNVTATLLPPPTITAIAPASGSVKGSKVTIAGTNFAGVQAVSFGSQPAKFGVESEGKIIATAPASAKLAKVSVSVTTPAGTVTSAQRYAYKGCRVPRLLGKSLKASRQKARGAGCKIGKVTKPGDAGGEVVAQNPKPGKLLGPGAKVKVTLAG
jgi:surface antigen